MKISLLIPTLPQRNEMFVKLREKLTNEQVEVISWDAENVTIGAKRNALLGWASGEYVAFIDDDDDVSGDYIEWLLKAANSGCDCASLKGIITIDGKNPEVFHHSMIYKEWKTNPEGETRYERGINHLNLVRTEIARQIKFPEINFGEDHKWSEELMKSGLLTTEFPIPDVIYFYKYITKK